MTKLLAFVVGCVLAGAALAQTTGGVNTPPGWIWTYMGPTFGADWGPRAGPGACSDITQYGGLGDNAFDNSAAFTSARAAGTKCVYFPPGKYYFAAELSVDVPANSSVMIEGAGSEITMLRFPSGSNGINITLHTRTATFTVRDLSILASGVPSIATIGLNLVQADWEEGSVAMQSSVQNVTFRGSDGMFQSNMWKYSVIVFDVTNINFINNAFLGTSAGLNDFGGAGETNAVGISFKGSPGSAGPPIIKPQVGAQYNIYGNTFYALNVGVFIDFLVQGVTVTNSTFVINNYGLVSNAPPDQKASILFMGSNCNNAKACVWDQTENGTPTAQYIGNMIYMGYNSEGIKVVTNQTIISKNIFFGNGPDSIAIHALAGSAYYPSIISDNIIGAYRGNNTAEFPAQSIGYGIVLDAFSQSIKVHDNIIDTQTVVVPIQNNSTFGDRNFIKGTPVVPLVTNVTGAGSNIYTATRSVSAGSPSVVSWAAHGLKPGAGIAFSSVGGLTGITASAQYFVSQTGFTLDSFSYSATFAGPVVNTGGTTSSLNVSTFPELTRLVVPATAGFVSGQYVSINGLVGVGCNFVTQVRVADTTHLDLATCLWNPGFAWTSGGTVSTLP